MTIYFENEWTADPEKSGPLTELPLEEIALSVAREALDEAGCPYEACCSLLITDDENIREMNREHRGIDRSTDVLSFPLLEYRQPGDFSFLEEDQASDLDFDPDTGELNLGDIVISGPHCIAQAEALGHSVRREFAFLIAHSMLHLMGYDHMDDAQEREMFSLQERILTELNITRN